MSIPHETLLETGTKCMGRCQLKGTIQSLSTQTSRIHKYNVNYVSISLVNLSRHDYVFYVQHLQFEEMKYFFF